MRVRRVPRAHLRDGVCKEPLAEDVGVFGKKAEDQPRHEVIHVMAALGFAPVGVVLQKLDIEPIEAAGRTDIEGIFDDFPDGADAGQGQEKAEMIGEILVGAGNSFAARQILGLEIGTVGGEDEFGFRLGGRRTVFKRLERFCDLSRIAGQDMNIVGLKNAAEVGLVGRARAQALDGGLLVAKSR